MPYMGPFKLIFAYLILTPLSLTQFVPIITTILEFKGNSHCLQTLSLQALNNVSNRLKPVRLWWEWCQSVSVEILSLAQSWGWPIIADVQSSFRTLEHPLVLSHAELLLVNHDWPAPDCILWISERWLKRLLYGCSVIRCSTRIAL